MSLFLVLPSCLLRFHSPQRFPLNADFLKDILQERWGTLLDNVVDPQAGLQVFQEAFHEGHKVFRCPDIAWHSLCPERCQSPTLMSNTPRSPPPLLLQDPRRDLASQGPRGDSHAKHKKYNPHAQRVPSRISHTDILPLLKEVPCSHHSLKEPRPTYKEFHTRQTATFLRSSSYQNKQ